MKGLADPRVPKYFYPVAKNTNGLQGQFLGNVPGGDNDDSGEGKFSRVGPSFASIGSPVTLLSYSEVQFIIAEIRFREGDHLKASAAFNNAIDADFVNVGNTAAEATTYRAQAAVAYDNTLERIMEQKWIVMFQLPYESWTDWRRTGFPVLTAAATNFTGGVIPRRLPYPQLEINLNRSSLESGPGVPVPYEALKAKVWWDN
jgi:hypothetical protein